ncbi:hypothetical protein BH11PLA2_BH11PLA2_16120 [soil metagenome]
MKNILGTPSGLISAAAFWRNDKPEGIGVTMRTSDDFTAEFMDMMSDTISICDRGWDFESDKHEVASHLLEQLRELAARKDSLTEEDNWRVIENVYLLEKHGVIPSDEYNGVIFHYDYGKLRQRTVSDGQHRTSVLPPWLAQQRQSINPS